MNTSYETIENLRKVTGTLPSERPEKKTDIKSLKDSLDITVEDHSKNPYKAMFVAATSTWGNNRFERKWPKTSIEGKLEVIKAVLTHNTLPQAKEMVNFVFRVNGVPRWLFDYHTQVPFITIMSIGCRDNNKLDSDIVLTESSEKDFIDTPVGEYYNAPALFNSLKDLYEDVLNADQSSWQSARTFLPQSYLHGYHFAQNLLALVSVRGFHATKNFGTTEKEKALEFLYNQIMLNISNIFPLIGHYMQIMHLHTSEQFMVFDYIRDLKVSELDPRDLKYFNQD